MGKTYKTHESYLVKTNQKQYTLIKGIFEKITTFDNNTFYDVSGFTMPLSFGMDFAPIGSREVSNAGDIVLPIFPTETPPEKASVAYLFEWNEYYAPRALNRILQAGLKPKVATKPFSINTAAGKIDMAAGSIMLPVGWQGGFAHGDVSKIMETIALKDGIKIHAVGSVRTPTAGMDLGSNNFKVIEKTKNFTNGR